MLRSHGATPDAGAVPREVGAGTTRVRNFTDYLRQVAHLWPTALALIAQGMQPTPSYFAAACTGCRRASLIVQPISENIACPRCGADCLLVPGAEYTAADVTLFTELEAVVHDAQLSSRGAALIAAELEAVGLRWEPPELVLARVARRLRGLQRVYSPRQDYGHLLLTVSMLLTIVCTRLQGPAEPRSARHHESGMHPAYDSEHSGATAAKTKNLG